jgi:hypothetical protein
MNCSIDIMNMHQAIRLSSLPFVTSCHSDSIEVHEQRRTRFVDRPPYQTSWRGVFEIEEQKRMRFANHPCDQTGWEEMVSRLMHKRKCV